MKKEQVKVGGVYTAKVRGGIAQVRITEEKWQGDKHLGWAGINTATKRPVRIKSAQRLRAAVATKAAAPEATAKPEVAPEKPGGPKKAHAGGKPKKQVRPVPGKRPVKPKGDRPLSGLDAAAKVLAGSGKPMRVSEVVEAMAAKGLWKSKAGKTPEATIYAAIIREIRDKGVDARFVKEDRGLFAATGEAKK